MTTRLTLFTARLVQDSALSVSGFDRETSADQPFAIVNGVPTLVGRGLKGAAVAMARRFFALPGAVSDTWRSEEKRPLRRSAWEFADAEPIGRVEPRLRAGVGIRQKTGARASGVLYDREVIPAGTQWQLRFRVDRSYTLDDSEFTEAEGILGYVLSEHWAKGRCWLGGGAARGLGWCHIEALKAYRLDEAAYEVWVKSDRKKLPSALGIVPTVSPTRSWCFRTLDVKISFGEYKPNASEAAWGLDMFAVGPHDAERGVQPRGDGSWAKPAWALKEPTPNDLSTDRALLMDGSKGKERPLLPGASVRGPLRHAFSRQENARAGELVVRDPNHNDSERSIDDLGTRAFGTVEQSSRILIRDARAEGEWAAAKLHMHAEDEFSAGSYGSSKRDAVRVLQAKFPVRIIVEGSGSKPEEVEQLVKLIDRQVALGSLGHLPIGGHKTRGAGVGYWQAQEWVIDDVKATPITSATPENWPPRTPKASKAKQAFLTRPTDTWVLLTGSGAIAEPLTLGGSAKLAQDAIRETLVAWWCDPTIDLELRDPPVTFGRQWPQEKNHLQVDEVAFYAARSVWRAVRTASGTRFIVLKELDAETDGARKARVICTPARLHNFAEGKRPRFSSAKTGEADLLVREWHVDGELLGFTLTQEQN